MKVPEKYYDEIFEFKGQWDIPSKCGLKTIIHNEKTYIIVSELYQDNPGTSVTYAGYSLFRQICESKGLSEKNIIYLECSPDTNSKLSFYDEEFFEVTFPETNGESGRPTYKSFPPNEAKELLS